MGEQQQSALMTQAMRPYTSWLMSKLCQRPRLRPPCCSGSTARRVARMRAWWVLRCCNSALDQIISRLWERGRIRSPSRPTAAPRTRAPCTNGYRLSAAARTMSVYTRVSPLAPRHVPRVAGAIYAVTHADAIPPAKDDAMVLLKQLAEVSRHDDGSVRFEVLQQRSRLNHFTIVEIWRDQKALDAHVMAAHTRQFREQFQPMSGSLYDERLYQALD